VQKQRLRTPFENQSGSAIWKRALPADLMLKLPMVAFSSLVRAAAGRGRTASFRRSVNCWTSALGAAPKRSSA
jgi:hypothetical protein